MIDHSFLHMQVYVATIAEQGSFSRAAKLLKTSQSFLTRKIGNLEKTLGVKLFDRSTRKLVLTPAGNLLLPEIQNVLASCRAGLESSSFLHADLEGSAENWLFTPDQQQHVNVVVSA